jgi:hypothetical protein
MALVILRECKSPLIGFVITVSVIVLCNYKPFFLPKMAAARRRQTLLWDPYITFFDEGKSVQCLYCQKSFQYKRDWVMNHFGYNAKSTQVMCLKIPPTLKEKFMTCNNIVPPRMFAVELWGTWGPPVSAGPARSSQST